MSPFWGHAIGVSIVAMMLAFGAIWFWAWRPAHKQEFDALARLPMGDADPRDVDACDVDARDTEDDR